MVHDIRIAEHSIGRIDYSLSAEKRKGRKFMRSLFVVEDVKAGETFTRDNVRSIRPGDGLAPCMFGKILRRKAKADIVRGTPLSWDLIG